MTSTAHSSDGQQATRVGVRDAVVAHLRSRAAVMVCARIALLVGTLLTLANQGDVLLADGHSSWVWAKVAMNYVVPFVVSSAGFVSASRASSPVNHGAQPDADTDRAST